ncbi:WD40 repeat-like protein [Trichoderma gracile]
MNPRRLLAKAKEKFHSHRSRSRSPSVRDGSSQSLPNIQPIVSASSASTNTPQNAPTITAEDRQSRHSLAIPTINEPAPEQETIVQDPPAAEPGDDDEEGKPAQTPSDEIWDRAYDELKAEEPALVQAYERILTAQLLCGNDGTADATSGKNRIEQHDTENRKSQMQKLVKNGLDKISPEVKAKYLIGEFLPIVDVSKNIVTNVVKGVPQAALPWAAISLSLELLTNPISETKANSEGVMHVVKQMNWYCELAALIFSDQNGSTARLQGELQTRLIDLYKKLLSFEIKSICSYYRHRGFAFLRDLVKLDDWKGNFDAVKDDEIFFNQQFHVFRSIDVGQDVKQLVLHAKDEQEYRKTEEDKKCLRDLYITDPQMDKRRIESTKGGLVQDSWRWILRHSDYQTWLRNDDKRLLWVKGDPGKGKTMLLCGLVNEITKRVAQSGNAVSYFFCQATMPTINNHLSVLRGLIWLIADQQPSLLSYVREKYDRSGKDLFEGPNAWYSLAGIFRSILQDAKLKMTYVIVDGLDECTTGLPELLELIKEILPLHNVKWILSSRNWPEIQAILEDTPDAQGVNLSLEVNAAVVADAVDAYISEKASKVKLFNRNDHLREEAFKLIKEKANGTFLWVSIVFQQLQRMKFLDGGLFSLMERLNAFPKGLTELYDRMLKQIKDLDSEQESELCQTVLGICVVAYQPLRLQELATLAGFEDDLTEPSALRTLIETCGSFLTVKDELVYFIHQSSKEYLTTSNGAQSAIFPNGTNKVHHKMAMQSLEIMERMLCRDMYKLQNPAILTDDISTPEPDPLVSLRYPCSYWLRHLCISMDSFDPSDGKVLKFLRKHILHWLEVMSLMGNPSGGVPYVVEFEHLLKQRAPTSELFQLVHDIRRFTQHNSWIVNNAPLQIYLSGILFAPKLSIVRSLFERELLSWISVKPFVEGTWSPCLQTIEANGSSFALSPDGKMLASCSATNQLGLWDVASGKQIRTLEAGSGIRPVVFSSDSKRVITVYGHRVVSLNVDPGIAHFHTWSCGAWPSISKDGKFIASSKSDGEIQIQDINTGQQLHLIQADNFQPDYLRLISLSNDAKYLAFPAGYKNFTIWDVEGHSINTTLVMRTPGAFCFSSDSTLMASICQPGSIKIWDLAMRHEIKIIPAMVNGCEAWFSLLDFSANSKFLAAGAASSIFVWDVVAGTLVTRLDAEWAGGLDSLSWSQDGKILASLHYRTIRVWDMTTSVVSDPVTELSRGFRLEAIAINDDSRLVAVRSSEIVKVWDTTTGSELALFQTTRFLGITATAPHSITFSPGSEFIYSHENASITEWDIDRGTKAREFSVPESDTLWTSRYAFSTDGKLFAAATASGEDVRIWATSTGQETVRFTVGHQQVWAMAFSNNAQYLSVSFSYGSVGVWDAITGDHIKYVKGHRCERSYLFVAVSDNARRVLVGYPTDREIWIHNEGQEMVRLILDRQSFGELFGATESYITTWGGYIDLDGLQTSCETLDPYQTMTLEDIRFEGYGLSADQSWITWNGSNLLWLPVTYRPRLDCYDAVALLPLGLFIMAGGRVSIIRFSGPPPE